MVHIDGILRVLHSREELSYARSSAFLPRLASNDFDIILPSSGIFVNKFKVFCHKKSTLKRYQNAFYTPKLQENAPIGCRHC